MNYTVVFTDSKGKVLDTKPFQAQTEGELVILVNSYAAQTDLKNYEEDIVWDASVVVKTGIVKRKENKEVEIDDTSDYLKEVYCRSCGESDNVIYVATYASGDYYRCTCPEGKEGFHA
ncbi:hypothetical protein [Bacillus thuringiensis]|uniref:Uncharacterized protein n=1 Tax=Bacillus thuringiensis TaxID=1428 RepID=A0A9X6WNH9_BACTU|nr:hypothetical protein [Bacillus thuringiensis]PFJ38768.1 hypothetical protein COJ15_16970 [Bacillus thuringiensis]